MTKVWDIETPTGLARAHVYPVAHGRARASLVLGHGIGGGVDSPDLVAIAEALPADGVEVVLVEQPWRVAGRRVGGAPATLDRAWVACLADLRSRGIGTGRLVVGGRSAGARVACRTVAAVQPSALLLLAFPLHAPGRNLVGGRVLARLPELVVASRLVPTVVLQGARDSFGTPAEVADGLAAVGIHSRVVSIAGADHTFRIPARSTFTRNREPLEAIVEAARSTTLGFLDGED